MSVKSLVYEDDSRFDFWLKALLGLVLAGTFVGGVALLSKDFAGAMTMFGVSIFDALLFKLIFPRKLQIFEDRVRVVLGGPFSFSIPFASIKMARRVPNSALLLTSVHFASSARFVVEIARKRGMGVTISPASGELFLEQLNQALRLYNQTKRDL